MEFALTAISWLACTDVPMSSYWWKMAVLLSYLITVDSWPLYFHKAYWYCTEIVLVKSSSCLRCRSLGLVRTMIYCVEIQQYLYYTNMWPSLQHLLYIYVRLSYSTESCLLTMILLLGACCAPWFRLHSSIWCSGIEISPLPPEIMWATMQLVHSQYRNGFCSQASLVR